MASIIYTLCALTAFLCSWLLLRAYVSGKNRLLLWGGLCFSFLTLNNIFVIADELIFPTVDLCMWRYTTALAGMLVLLYGLIWDTE